MKISLLTNGLIIISLVLYTSCKCSRVDDDIAKIEPLPPHDAEVIKETADMRSFPMSGTVRYEHYAVDYEVLKNDKHPNGYVIITQVETPDVSLLPSSDKTKEEYIKTIHSVDKFLIQRKSSTATTLADKETRDIFRTAEAILIVYFMKQEMNRGNLVAAAERMKDRKVGIVLDRHIFE